MFGLLRLWVGILVRLFQSRRSLLIENLALRQQLAVFKRQNSRPGLTVVDKLFWLLLRRFWGSWKKTLILVSPDTVVRWHRAGFRLYWRLISRVRKPVGRRPVKEEIRELIFQMVAENPTWRAPRIHGELVMLGFQISERSVSRWMRHAPRTPESAQRWLTFLRNHREAIAANGLLLGTDHYLRCALLFLHHWPPSAAHSPLQRHPPSDQHLDRAAVARSLSLRTGDRVSHPGSRLQVWRRSTRRDSLHGHQGCADRSGLSLAEWGCRALGRQLPPRVAGSRDCHQRVASKAATLFLCRVLPPGSHPLWTSETDSEKEKALLRPREGGSLASCRWSSSSLRTRRLNLPPFYFPPSRHPDRLIYGHSVADCHAVQAVVRLGSSSILEGAIAGSTTCY